MCDIEKEIATLLTKQFTQSLWLDDMKIINEHGNEQDVQERTPNQIEIDKTLGK